MDTKDADSFITIDDVPKAMKKEAINLLYSYPKIEREEQISKLVNSTTMQNLRAFNPEWAPLAVDYSRETF